MAQAQQSPRCGRKHQCDAAVVYFDLRQFLWRDIIRLHAAIDRVEVWPGDRESFFNAECCTCPGVYRNLDRIVDTAVDHVDRSATTVRVVGSNRVDKAYVAVPRLVCIGVKCDVEHVTMSVP